MCVCVSVCGGGVGCGEGGGGCSGVGLPARPEFCVQSHDESFSVFSSVRIEASSN